MKFFRLAGILCLFTLSVLAQDPLVVAPQAYKLQFENDWVKVMRVHYAPHVSLPVHQHTETAAAFVYLNDSGPVVFKHQETTYGPVTRQPTKAGGFRLFRAVPEVHAVENLSELPSDFLRVEFKTDPKDENSLRGKFYREDYAAGKNYQKVQFENDQVRITRLVCAAGKTLNVSTSAKEPALLVALTPAKFKVPGSNAGQLNLELGHTAWLDLNKQKQLENTGDAAAELLRFDFKTAPLSKEELDKKKQHVHPKN
jgi:hypothetical protein